MVALWIYLGILVTGEKNAFFFPVSSRFAIIEKLVKQ